MKTRKQLHQFALYDTLDSTHEGYIKSMSAWAKRLERDGKIGRKWCINNERIDVIGDVNLRGMEIEFSFGVIGGFFYCVPDQEDSPNYPTHVGQCII